MDNLSEMRLLLLIKEKLSTLLLPENIGEFLLLESIQYELLINVEAEIVSE